jgi:hypothetical protein
MPDVAVNMKHEKVRSEFPAPRANVTFVLIRLIEDRRSLVLSHSPGSLYILSSHIWSTIVDMQAIPADDRPDWRSPSDLPVECVIHAMSFLPLTDKYMCRSVSKKWNFCASEALKDQEVIVLSLGKDWSGCDVDHKNAMHFVCEMESPPKVSLITSLINDWFPKPHDPKSLLKFGPDEIWKMLSHLKRSKKISIAGDLQESHRRQAYNWGKEDGKRWDAYQPFFYPIVDRMIPVHSQSLTSLDIGDECLPSGSEVFIQLKELTCRLMTEQDVSRCPRLRKLNVMYTNSLEGLPIGMMVELELRTASVRKQIVGFNELRNNVPTDDMNQLLLVIPRLVNLKVLQIYGFILSRQIPYESRGFKRKLLRNHQKLEILALRFAGSWISEDEEAHDDEFVDQLVRTNTMLREVHSLFVTEAGIRSLSSLNHLTKVTGLRMTSAHQYVPMLMIILTGESAHCLQEIEFGSRYCLREPGFNFDHMWWELEYKIRESGLPFKVSREYPLKVTRVSDSTDENIEPVSQEDSL